MNSASDIEPGRLAGQAFFTSNRCHVALGWAPTSRRGQVRIGIGVINRGSLAGQAFFARGRRRFALG